MEVDSSFVPWTNSLPLGNVLSNRVLCLSRYWPLFEGPTFPRNQINHIQVGIYAREVDTYILTELNDSDWSEQEMKLAGPAVVPQCLPFFCFLF